MMSARLYHQELPETPLSSENQVGSAINLSPVSLSFFNPSEYLVWLGTLAARRPQMPFSSGPRTGWLQDPSLTDPALRGESQLAFGVVACGKGRLSHQD